MILLMVLVTDVIFFNFYVQGKKTLKSVKGVKNSGGSCTRHTYVAASAYSMWHLFFFVT